jgi:hypothetical protein
MRCPKITTRRLLVAIAALGSVLGGLRFLHDGYYEEHIRVLRELEGVRGISDVEVYGYDDITYEVVGTRFQIAGRPEAVIVIQQSKESLVGSPKHLALQRLGPWEFHECSYGFEGAFETNTGRPAETLSYRNYIDIGPLDKLGTTLPVKILDVNDIVTHYDELVRFFSTWPDEKVWGRLDEPSGMRRAYCRMTTPGKRPIPPPPNFPKTW